MRVLHLLPGGTRGGMETLVARYMGSSKHEHDYCALFLEGPVLDELPDDVEVFRFASKGLAAKRAAVKELVKSGRYDAVVSHQWFGKPAIILDSIHFGDVPLVVVLHSSYEPVGGLRDSAAMLGFTKRLYAKADRVVAISRFVERNHREWFGLDDRATVIYNAVDGERFEAASDVGRPLSDPLRVLYLGRLEQIKGVDVLIRACAELDARGVAYELTVAGWGSQRDELEELACELGVSVRFSGETQEPESLYAEADVFVHPAVCDEGFGLTTVEAMTSGCICVVSAAGGLPEVVDDGVNGFLFERGNVRELADRLQRISALSADEVRDLRISARRRSRDFGWGDFVDAYDSLIDEVCGARGRAHGVRPYRTISLGRDGDLSIGCLERCGEPLVSVIVPVYNVADYLDECVESIRWQSLADIEIILVDDGSTDGCGALCDGYAKADPRIRVIHQENKGLSAARNAGLAVARAGVVSFIDSDDVVHPDMLKALYGCLESQGSDVSVCRYERFSESYGYSFAEYASVRAVAVPAARALEAIYNNELPNMEFVAWNKLYRKRLFDETGILYPEGRIYEDAYTTYRLLYMAGDVSFVDAPLYLYRSRPGSIIDSMRVLDASRMDGLDADFGAYVFFADKEPALARAATKTVLRTCMELWHDARGTCCQEEAQAIALEVYEYVWGRSSHVLDAEPAKKVLYATFRKAPGVALKLLRAV